MSIDEASLPPALRRGLEALRVRACADAVVAAVDGNFALIDLGTMSTPGIFVEREARLFARTPLDFINADPYGVITRPYLCRVDGAVLPHQHRSHANARPIEVPGTPTGFWSWDWKNIPRRQPEDLSLIYEWALKCIRDGGK